MKLYTSSETKKIDRLAIKKKGISAFSLMMKAAEFSFNTILENWPNTTKAIIFCSKGNNTGDGYLLAALLKEAGIQSQIVQITKREGLSPATAKGLRVCKQRKVKTIKFSSFKKMKIEKNTVLIDALLGTGLKGKVRKELHQAIEFINKKSKNYPLLSLDIPSGICADSGTELGASILADVTTTFVGRKRGCYTSRGKERAGKVYFNDLLVGKDIFKKVDSSCYILNMEDHLKKINQRNLNTHKGHYGHVLIIGGNTGFGGAAILAAKAAARSGAGLVSLATRPEHMNAALSQCPEIMVKGVNSGQDLEPFLSQPKVLAIGPGLGQDAWSEQLLQRTLWETKNRNIPIVMDADSLNLLPKMNLTSSLPQKIVITPHPGEASKLLKKTVNEIEIDRFKSVKELQKKLKAVVVLKGSGSLICFNKRGKQIIGVCEAGNPGMASGGMGDILSGLIASFIAQGLNVIQATEAAVDIHSKASDLTAMRLGQLGMLASDVLEDVIDLLRH